MRSASLFSVIRKKKKFKKKHLELKFYFTYARAVDCILIIRPTRKAVFHQIDINTQLSQEVIEVRTVEGYHT